MCALVLAPFRTTELLTQRVKSAPSPVSEYPTNSLLSSFIQLFYALIMHKNIHLLIIYMKSKIYTTAWDHSLGDSDKQRDALGSSVKPVKTASRDPFLLSSQMCQRDQLHPNESDHEDILERIGCITLRTCIAGLLSIPIDKIQ